VLQDIHLQVNGDTLLHICDGITKIVNNISPASQLDPFTQNSWQLLLTYYVTLGVAKNQIKLPHSWRLVECITVTDKLWQ